MAATPINEPVSQSDIIFNGTVEQAGATTMPSLEATDSTAVVRVDEVIRAPEAFTGLAGTQVTVILRDPGSLQEGEQATFFANGAVFGDSIAVEEVEHRSVTATASALKSEVTDILERSRQDEIQARAASADAVVAGRVAHVSASPVTAEAESGQPGPLSEHYPDWIEALIDVEDVLRGQVSADPIILLFPESIDVMWVNAPKFHAGQEGIWFLHTEQVPAAAAARFPSVYTALSPDDFHPRERWEQVRGLVDALGG